MATFFTLRIFYFGVWIGFLTIFAGGVETELPPLEKLLGHVVQSHEKPLPQVFSSYSGEKIWEVDFLYESALSGDSSSLEILKQKALNNSQQDPFPALMMVCYYSHPLKQDISKQNEYLASLRIFFKVNPKVLEAFFEVPTFSAWYSRLAVYHRELNRLEVAEKFARQAINNGDSEGYNVLAILFLKKSDTQKALESSVKAALLGNGRGIYNVAKLCPKIDGREWVRNNLYRHAMVAGLDKALYDLGEYYENRGHHKTSCEYFLALIRKNPNLYLYLQRKKKKVNISVFLLQELLQQNSSVCAPLLKTLYSRSQDVKMQKWAAHLMAKGLDLGIYGFSRDWEKAVEWFQTSILLGNEEDSYHLYHLHYENKDKIHLSKLIEMGRELTRQTKVIQKYGKNHQILHARSLVEHACQNHHKPYFEEAIYWFLDALEPQATDSGEVKTVWSLPFQGGMGTFEQAAEDYQKMVNSVSSRFNHHLN